MQEKWKKAVGVFLVVLDIVLWLSIDMHVQLMIYGFYILATIYHLLRLIFMDVLGGSDNMILVMNSSSMKVMLVTASSLHTAR